MMPSVPSSVPNKAVYQLSNYSYTPSCGVMLPNGAFTKMEE